MDDDKKSSEKDPKTEVESKRNRDVAMFKDWIAGSTLDSIAKSFGVSVTTVYQTSVKYKWKELKKELRKRLYNDAIDGIRETTILVQSVLEQDIKRIAATIAKEDRMLSKEERDHMRSMYDRMLKEIRLEDGKPTETDSSNGLVARVEIILPEGAKRFGVIPPDPKTIIHETSKEKKAEEEKNVIDLDEVEYDPKK